MCPTRADGINWWIPSTIPRPARRIGTSASLQAICSARVVSSGVVISIARSLAFNGLANAGQMLAINAGSHVSPLFAGDTIYAWSEVLDKAVLSETCGALRLRLVAVKDQDPGAFAYRTDAGKYADGVLLDFDYWAAIPKR